jgi:hypothetical protein
MTQVDDIQQRLRTAADRLLAGTPQRSTGKLTIVDLAAEADVKRWILTHKHPDLMRAYQVEFATACEQRQVTPTSPNGDRIRALEKQLGEARNQNRALTELVRTYAVVINDLAEEVIAVTRERDEARTARERLLTNVSVLPDRRPQRTSVVPR